MVHPSEGGTVRAGSGSSDSRPVGGILPALSSSFDSRREISRFLLSSCFPLSFLRVFSCADGVQNQRRRDARIKTKKQVDE